MKKYFIPLLYAAFILMQTNAIAQAVTDQQLGLMYYNNKEFDKSAAVFERLFNENPSVLNYTYLLQSLLEEEDFNKAEKIVKKQAKNYPEEARYKVDQGYLLLRSNQGNKANRVFEQAIKDMPSERRNVLELANAFMVRREYGFAIQTYMKGRQLLAPEYYFGLELANLHEMTGNFEKMSDEYISLLETNPELINQMQARLQNSLNNDPEGLKAEAFRIALLKKIQKSPDEMMVSEMILWLSIQIKDFDAALIQAKALDRRLGEGGGRVFKLGGLSVGNGYYKTGAEAYQYVIDHADDIGLVVQSRVELLKAEYEQIIRIYPVDQKALVNLEKKYKTTLNEAGKNPLIFPLMRNLAHLQAFYLNNTDEAIVLLEELVVLSAGNPQLQAESKLELADIMLFTGEPWEATLLYSQVDKAFKNEPIGHEARFRNARLSFFIGEFNWAKAQLDVLKAATSKLIANDAMALSLLISDNIEADSSTTALQAYAYADLLLFRNKPVEALAMLDSIGLVFPNHSITDDVLMKKAEIKIKQGKIADAITLYRKVTDEYGDGIRGANALFNLAMLYDQPSLENTEELSLSAAELFFLGIQDPQFKDHAKAMVAYQELLTKYPGSLFTVEARKRFRTLRGDMIN